MGARALSALALALVLAGCSGEPAAGPAPPPGYTGFTGFPGPEILYVEQGVPPPGCG